MIIKLIFLEKVITPGTWPQANPTRGVKEGVRSDHVELTLQLDHAARMAVLSVGAGTDRGSVHKLVWLLTSGYSFTWQIGKKSQNSKCALAQKQKRHKRWSSRCAGGHRRDRGDSVEVPERLPGVLDLWLASVSFHCSYLDCPVSALPYSATAPDVSPR